MQGREAICFELIEMDARTQRFIDLSRQNGVGPTLTTEESDQEENS
jgi:hypothetical protein